MPIYPYSFQLPPLNVQDIPNDGEPGEFLGINVGGALDWLPAGGGGSGDMLAANNLSELTNFATARTNIGLGTGNSPQFTGLQFSTDTFLIRGGAANLHLGAADAASPVAQTLSVQSVVAGTTNTAGQAFTIDGSQGTGTGAGGALIFRTAAAGSSGSTVNALGTRMVINAAGNVGIGTTAPAQKLEVWGNSGSTISKVTSVSPGTGSILWLDGPIGQLVTSTGNLFITNQSAANGIVFETNATEKMRLLSNGNLGIGTTAPSEKLDVAGNAQFVGTSPYLNLKSSTGGNYYIQSNANVIGTGSGNYLGYISPVGRGHTWCEGTTSRMMIEPTTGNVGIGTTSPTSKLHVAGTIKPEQATMVDKAAGFTLAAVDAGTVINVDSATDLNITLPTTDMASGYNVMIIQTGVGIVTIVPGGANTLQSFGGTTKTAGRYAACSIVRTAASTYNLSGNLV